MCIVPFKLSDHLVHYFFKNLHGEEKKYAGIQVKVIRIYKHSFIGKLLISNIRKIDYPVKDIKDFNLFIEMKNVQQQRWCSKQKLFKRENLSSSFVEIPEELMKEINSQLDDIFRQNFFHYVLGKTEGNDAKVQTIIKKWMDDHELWNFGFDADTLRRHYYRMKDKGAVTYLQSRDMGHCKTSSR